MVAVPGPRASCTFRFHGRLDTFLARGRRGAEVVHAFDGTPAVQNPIEALGVPHTEVGRLLINGLDTRLSQHVRGGERVDVEPLILQRIDHAPRFVLDVHLGRLAGYLRLVGIDTAYSNDADDGVLIARAHREVRTLLTRDTGLLKRASVLDAALVYATDPRRQLREVLDRFELHPRLEPFSRCANCNGIVEAADAAAAGAHVPPRVLAACERFKRRPDCRRFDWRGTHESRLRQGLAEVGVQL